MSTVKTTNGIIIADDKYDDHRCKIAKSVKCEVCLQDPGQPCKPAKGDVIYDLNEDFVHMLRESRVMPKFDLPE